MSVNPGFGGQTFIRSSLKKMELLAKIRGSRGLEFRIEVDGGVHHETVADIVQAGAEILVAGSAVFEHATPRESARRLLESALDASAQSARNLSPAVGGATPADARTRLTLS